MIKNYLEVIMVSKKEYDANLKAKLALEFIAGKKSVVELSAEYKIPQTTLHDWRSKLLDNAKEIFISESEKNKQVKLLEQQISSLHKIIGEITVENNFLKKS